MIWTWLADAVLVAPNYVFFALLTVLFAVMVPVAAVVWTWIPAAIFAALAAASAWLTKLFWQQRRLPA